MCIRNHHHCHQDHYPDDQCVLLWASRGDEHWVKSWEDNCTVWQSFCCHLSQSNLETWSFSHSCNLPSVAMSFWFENENFVMFSLLLLLLLLKRGLVSCKLSVSMLSRGVRFTDNWYINTFQKYWWKDFERIPIPIKFCIDFIISNITNATVVPPWLLNFLSVLQNFSLLHCWVIQRAE